jgi:autotransporter-associated beta strand protein
MRLFKSLQSGADLFRQSPRQSSSLAVALGMLVLGALTTAQPGHAQQRVLGLDISAWQGNISQTTWNNLRNVENRQFVILRSSRGGTTGYYNQSDPNNLNGLNTLSQRYDDPYFVQNVNRAATAGMFVGSYHFSRPEIIETTENSGGVRNSGTNEADHFIQMAGAWMRPGYLIPVHDLESGEGFRTDEEMAQFSIDFSDRIYQVMGIRPAIYVNGNYAAFVIGGASLALRNQIAQPPAVSPTMTSPANLKLWSARWPNQADPNSIDVQNGEPKDSYTQIYGPWDDYGTVHPWTFWQYASTGRLLSFDNGGANLDFNVANGGLEFLKDQLVPALWMNDMSGLWTTLTNWNSGQTPVAPVTGPGQVAPVGTQTLPTPRLPGAAGSGVTSGQHDTVILERPNANITVTLASGTHNIRKLYMRETLNITGGSLTVNYAPSPDSTPVSAQFSGPVNLSSSGSLSVHTLQVDLAQTFRLGGGTLTFNTIQLQPNTLAPAKIAFAGNVIINPLTNSAAIIQNGAGAGSSGVVDLNAGNPTFTIGNGTAEVDLSVTVPIQNGAWTKVGLGTMQITAANNYSDGTIVSAGRLLVNNTSGSGTGAGAVTVNGGILGGTGSIAGVVTVNAGGTLTPGTASVPGALTLNSAPVLTGTTSLRIDRNSGSPVTDKIVLISGTLNYDGALVVSNIGASLVGGEVFELFAAPAYSGAFVTSSLPVLSPGLNWSTSSLTLNGRIKVNRSPVAGPVSFTNDAPNVLQIPIATLIDNASDADGDILTLAGINLTSSNGVVLFTNDTVITYSNFVSVADQLTYALSDGQGGSVIGTVQIVASPTGRFTVTPGGNGTAMSFDFVGSPGWTYFLERSTNLPAWVTIWTNVAPASGLFEYIDNFQDLPTPPSRAFYRLRWSP